MSKILAASCVASVVTCESLPVPTAEILSEGKGESQGVLVMQGDKQYYICSNATDLKEVIEKLNDLIAKLASTFTSIGAGMTGPTTAPPPTLASDVAELIQINVELTALKNVLK